MHGSGSRIGVVTEEDGIPPVRDIPVLSSHPVSPSLHHGGAAEIKKSHLLLLLILESLLARTGDLAYLRTHLLHLALMTRKMIRSFWKELLKIWRFGNHQGVDVFFLFTGEKETKYFRFYRHFTRGVET